MKLVPDLAPYNLFSITWALNNGFQLGNKGRTITLTKGNFTLSFDQEIQTKSGYLAGVETTGALVIIMTNQQDGKSKERSTWMHYANGK